MFPDLRPYFLLPASGSHRIDFRIQSGLRNHGFLSDPFIYAYFSFDRIDIKTHAFHLWNGPREESQSSEGINLTYYVEKFLSSEKLKYFAAGCVVFLGIIAWMSYKKMISNRAGSSRTSTPQRTRNSDQRNNEHEHLQGAN
uniref:Signal sequence receptor subunit alpha n=1 Tax=Caenorhabditis tropicalis TaxID=1561998 RepID=A0A1I7UUC2_9PELO